MGRASNDVCETFSGADASRRLKGKKVEACYLNRFSAGKARGWAYLPRIVFEDGSVLSFAVQETDAGAYGVDLVLIRKKKEAR